MLKQILKTAFIAGSLDLAAACIQAYLTNKTTPDIILKYIASGMFGKEAFEGGYRMIATGLFFHFMIAFACTAVFFLLYPKLKFLHHQILLNSFLIGVVAWAVTTQIIVPVSKIGTRPFDIQKTAIAIGILIVCIGMPISIAAKKYFVSGRK